MEKKTKRLRCLELFQVFFKIGAFTFGGGYAMIPLIQREASEQKKWISEEDILEIVAIAESTPGPIAINAATFIGNRVAGFFGALCATLGVVLPSFCIIAVIAGVLRQFESLKAVRYAFWGIRAGVLALIVKALYTMYRQCPKNVVAYLIAGGAFVATLFSKINILWIIIGCGVAGWMSYTIITGKEKE